MTPRRFGVRPSLRLSTSTVSSNFVWCVQNAEVGGDGTSAGLAVSEARLASWKRGGHTTNGRARSPSCLLARRTCARGRTAGGTGVREKHPRLPCGSRGRAGNQTNPVDPRADRVGLIASGLPHPDAVAQYKGLRTKLRTGANWRAREYDSPGSRLRSTWAVHTQNRE